MGYIDSQLLFSSAQNAFVSGADVNSTNLVDLAPHLPANQTWTPDPLSGETMEIVVLVTTAFSGGTSMQVVLQADTNSNFATAKTEPVMSYAFPVASLTAGKQIILRVPTATAKRYLRLAYRNVGANSAGAVTSWITHEQTDLTNTAPVSPSFYVA